MKLSELIRQGCEGSYQIFGKGSDGWNGKCAMRGAWDVFMSNRPCDEATAIEWSALASGSLPDMHCPTCHVYRASHMSSMVVHLNDGHQMSREAIAMWVESVENEIQKKAQEKLSQVVDGNSNVCREEEEAAQESVAMYNDIYEDLKV
jgi:hypothetical protein